MPFYDLRCKKCGIEFNMKATITMRENQEIICPECGNNDLESVYKSLNYVVRNKKSDVCPQAHRCGGHCCH